MKIKSLVFGDFLDFSDKNSSNIVNNQLTGLVLLCKVFETSSQSSTCLLVLPHQWTVRNKQNKFYWSLVFPYCTYAYVIARLYLLRSQQKWGFEWQFQKWKKFSN